MEKQNIIEKITEFSVDMKLPGKYVAAMCKDGDPVDIDDSILYLLCSKDIELFYQAIDFIVYLFTQTRIIPGDYEVTVVNHLKQSKHLENFFLNEIFNGNFAKADYIVSQIQNLDFFNNKENIDTIFYKSMKKSPMLLDTLVAAVMTKNGEFPNEWFRNIDHSDKDLKIFNRFIFLNAYTVDTFTRLEELKQLETPESLVLLTVIQSSIEKNEEMEKGFLVDNNVDGIIHEDDNVSKFTFFEQIKIEYTEHSIECLENNKKPVPQFEFIQALLEGAEFKDILQ